MQHLIIDGHNDLAWATRRERGYRADGLEELQPNLQTSIRALREGGVGAQFWSVWVSSALEGSEQVTGTLEQIDWVERFIHTYPDDLARATTAAEVREAMAAGKIASLMGLEGGGQIDNSLAVLRQYARLGCRYMTLTWSKTIDWADSATDEARHGGLTDFGRDVVREMNRIGMLIDLAHVSPDTMRDALDVSTRPVLITHSGAMALCEHPRNVPDDVIRRIGELGGVIMAPFVTSFLSPAVRDHVNSDAEGAPPVVTVADVADHIEYIRDLAGVDAVGIGSDFDGTDLLPEGLEDVSGYPNLLAELERRGWSDPDLAKVANENVLRVLEASDADYLAFLRGESLPGPDALTPAVNTYERTA